MIKLFSVIIVLIMVFAVVKFGGFLWDSYAIAPEEGAEKIVFEIEQGQNVKEISKNLKEQGIIKSSGAFEFFLKWKELDRNLQAGEFTLMPGTNYQLIAAELSRAEANETQVTFPEGFTVDQIGERVIKNFPHITKAEWDLAAENKEGYLFPDTYRFRQDIDAKTIVEIMEQTLTRRLAENKLVVDRDDIILASILEKEVQNANDMAMVADIFLKRMEIGMALQADSTVNYVIGGDSPSLTLEQTKLDSPYNTYKYKGLTPGPISNPGINAISAAVNPKSNPYYYFLTSPEGTVYYAKTFNEHVANKHRYLR